MKLQKQSLEKSCVTKHDIVLQLNDSTSFLAFLNFNKNLSNCYPYLDHQWEKKRVRMYMSLNLHYTTGLNGDVI